MEYVFGLREKKKAQVRIDILNVTVKLMKEKSFEDIHVREICDQVSISNVTFFKYFQKKEIILEYLEAVWTYLRWTVLQEGEMPIGKAAMVRLFDDLANTDNGQIIVNTIERYITKSSYKRDTLMLSECEKWLLYPKKIYKEVPTIGQQLSLAFDQAVENNEVSCSIGKMEFLVLLTTIYYGTPVVTHLESRSLKDTFELLLNFVFRLSKDKEA